MLTGQEIAEAVSDSMFANDRVSQAMGFEILSISPGQARLAMTVRDDMLNGFDICHGGMIATLADSCFAFACNSRNQLTVASGFAIDIVAPAQKGDRLTAQASEVSLSGRTGVYDILVSNQHDELVAVFRGRSYCIKGKPVMPLPGPTV